MTGDIGRARVTVGQSGIAKRAALQRVPYLALTARICGRGFNRFVCKFEPPHMRQLIFGANYPTRGIAQPRELVLRLLDGFAAWSTRLRWRPASRRPPPPGARRTSWKKAKGGFEDLQGGPTQILDVSLHELIDFRREPFPDPPGADPAREHLLQSAACEGTERLIPFLRHPERLPGHDERVGAACRNGRDIEQRGGLAAHRAN